MYDFIKLRYVYCLLIYNDCNVLMLCNFFGFYELINQSYPIAYALDTKGLEEEMRKVAGPWEVVKEEGIENTKKVWERIYDQPYEKAGGLSIGNAVEVKTPIHWEITDTDANAKYSSMLPRFLLEVSWIFCFHAL